jgi:hypothetical protein
MLVASARPGNHGQLGHRDAGRGLLLGVVLSLVLVLLLITLLLVSAIEVWRHQ